MKDVMIKTIKKYQGKNTILIEGLPGVGNVGKIAVDFMIEALGAKKMYELYSLHFPHCSFVNEKGGFDLPSVRLYHLKRGKKDIVFLSGDVQPSTEVGCYLLSDT